MVAAYHLIWTLYGVWLPNDPRGSNSTEIRSLSLEDLGTIHFGRKKIQPCSAIIRKFYCEAESKLKHETMILTDDEIQRVAKSIAITIDNRRYTCFGCEIMPDHVHIVIRKHRDHAEEMIGFLQDDSAQLLIDEKCRPAGHPVWGGPGWRVYLNTTQDIERTIRYVCDNPTKAGMPEQVWDFVKAYDGWLPGVGKAR